MAILQNDLNPDGLRIVVNWDKFSVGTSVFVPCIDTQKAGKQLDDVVKDLNFVVKTQVAVRDGKLGIRAWRIT